MDLEARKLGGRGRLVATTLLPGTPDARKTWEKGKRFDSSWAFDSNTE